MSSWQIDYTKFLTEDQVSQLKDAVKRKAETGNSRVWKQNWLLVDLSFSSGLRVAEIRALKISDFSFDGNSFLTVQNGKGGKKRNVLIPASLVKHIGQYIQDQKLSLNDFLFCNKQRQPLRRRTLQLKFKRCLELANLPKHLSIHSARHSYCSLLLHKGADLQLVRSQAGHSSIQTTSVYLHSDLNQVSNVINQIF